MYYYKNQKNGKHTDLIKNRNNKWNDKWKRKKPERENILQIVLQSIKQLTSQKLTAQILQQFSNPNVGLFLKHHSEEEMKASCISK